MATNITQLIIGLLFFSSLVGGAVMFSSGMLNYYNPGAKNDITLLSEGDNTSFIDMTNVSSTAQVSQTKLTEQGTKTLTAADVILTGGWTSLVNLITVPNMLSDLFMKIMQPTSEGGMGIDFIPTWFIALIIGTVTVFIVYRIIGISTRSESGGI